VFPNLLEFFEKTCESGSSASFLPSIREDTSHLDLTHPHYHHVHNPELACMMAAMEAKLHDEEKDHLKRNSLLSRFSKTLKKCFEGAKEFTGIIKSTGPLNFRVLGDLSEIEIAALLAYFRLFESEARFRELKAAIGPNKLDPRWLEAGFNWATSTLARVSPSYVSCGEDMNKFIYELPEMKSTAPFKIAFISDWATGSLASRALIRAIYSDSSDYPRVLIHLGDVYYAGTEKEQEENFYNEIMKNVPEDVVILHMPGNHDYYCKEGKPYYEIISRMRSEKRCPQEASFFCLRNDKWQIISMDTGLHDRNPITTADGTAMTFLEEEEKMWVLDKLKNSGRRKNIVLSHHMLFSSTSSCGVHPERGGKKFSPVNDNLYRQLQDGMGKINVWLWGHEHNFVVYEDYVLPNGSKVKGRLIGAGGVPVLLNDHPYKQLDNLDLEHHSCPQMMDIRLGSSDGCFYNTCYAVGTFDGEFGRMDYYELPRLALDLWGKPAKMYSEQL
jgi:hypothetical protein